MPALKCPVLMCTMMPVQVVNDMAGEAWRCGEVAGMSSVEPSPHAAADGSGRQVICFYKVADAVSFK